MIAELVSTGSCQCSVTSGHHRQYTDTEALHQIPVVTMWLHCCVNPTSPRFLAPPRWSSSADDPACRRRRRGRVVSGVDRRCGGMLLSVCMRTGVEPATLTSSSSESYDCARSPHAVHLHELSTMSTLLHPRLAPGNGGCGGSAHSTPRTGAHSQGMEHSMCCFLQLTSAFHPRRRLPGVAHSARTFPPSGILIRMAPTSPPTLAVV